MNKQNKTIILKIAFISVLIVYVAYSFYVFTRDNHERIIEQNNNFIEAATEQTAARINDMIESSQKNVELIAYLYGSVMSEPIVDAAMLEDMAVRSPFDYVEFISPDGIDHTADGRTADLSDREYFKQGIKGGSGKCVVYNSRITNETLLIFYTPFYYQNEIIGVLSGIMRGDTINELLSTTYFGVDGSSYLLEKN